MRALLIAIGFLTRIPVPARVLADRKAQASSLTWYPAVGALIGLLLALLATLLDGAPDLLTAALVLLAWVALSGGMHLDGLADSADAWVGGMGNAERTLAIMKDPACGPMGVLAIVLALLLKFAALASLLHAAWPLLVLVPMLARAAMTALFLTTPYVRPGGLGDLLQHAPRRTCHIALAITAAAALLTGWPGLALILVTAAITWWLRRASLARINGFTGDLAGALGEITETALILTAALLSSAA